MTASDSMGDTSIDLFVGSYAVAYVTVDLHRAPEAVARLRTQYANMPLLL